MQASVNASSATTLSALETLDVEQMTRLEGYARGYVEVKRAGTQTMTLERCKTTTRDENGNDERCCRRRCRYYY